jgi:hypothetical protein
MLSPVHGEIERDASLSREDFSKGIRALYEDRLLVTKADLVRYVFLTNARDDGDRAVAIYPTQSANESSSATYTVTAMVASGSVLGKDAKHVKVRRYDAALPASTATIVHALWLAVLARTRHEPWAMCGPGAIFSATTASRTRLTAVAIAFDENSIALAMISLSEQLVKYPQLSKTKRPAAVQEIQEGSARLLQRIEHVKRLTKRSSEPRTILMPSLGSMRKSLVVRAVADLGFR